ncbi:MAG: peptide chain release factor 2 [Chloroflexi bacterium]|nr:peptide chain release factor 2 [Chloroflexota bacterium]MBL7061216.1 peptide chain release factor 2 [Dehalococcoidia bacterium]
MQEEKEKLEALHHRISDIMVRLDISAKEKEIDRLEAKTTKPDFWLDPAKAQSIMRQLVAAKGVAQTWHQMQKEITELLDVTTLAIEENDQSLREEIQRDIEKIASHLNELETRLILSDEYDDRDAILTVHAGAGGTESQDWAEMLLRMYLRWAERHKYKTEILDTSVGDEAGIRNATVEIRGDHVYGYLKSEHGVHRLVRLSPFNADHARHTSFVLTEVLPEAKEEIDIKINPDDLKIDTFRSSGPGGQHMQKTSSAVRITHLPTGLVVNCQSQRSQHKNKESALKVLYARLLQLERAKREAEKAKLKGERIEAGWGNQIRSYVLHPYRMVKDHRTDYETSDTTAVLDGELDDFITAYLRHKLGEGK